MFKIQPTSRCFQIASMLTLIAVGLAAIPRVQAQTAVIQFEGSVSGRCDFSNISGGSLGLSADGLTLDSQSGSAGAATLTCNQPSRLEVNAPVQLSSIPLTITSSSAQADINGNSCGGKNPFSETVVATNTDTPKQSNTPPGQMTGCHEITVNMSVTNNTPMPAGSYRFRVRLTAVAP
jgi:hypothetical protein